MICIPVVAGTLEGALTMIRRGAARAQILELRLDLLPRGNLNTLVNAVRAVSPTVRVLVTCRRPSHPQRQDEEIRIDRLCEAVSLGADFLDIEFETASDLREYLMGCVQRQGRLTSVILSHHDFKKTPSTAALRRYISRGAEAGAEIVKIVTQARYPEDNLTILGLIPYARGRNMEIVAHCMGNLGRMSRVMAPLVGSLFTFASLDRGSESAEGQLTAAEMERVFRILK